MTKYGCFKLVSFLLIVFVLVAVCVVEGRLVVGSLDAVNRYCYEIEEVAVKEGTIVNGQVASLVDNLEYCWKKNEGLLCYLANHKSIEQLGVEIVRLKTYIDEEEPIEFFTSLEIIKHYVETFQHFMGSSIHNVL